MWLTSALRGERSRRFFTEILIVVIGVLIALAAGEAAEGWNWQRKVAQGEQQLLQESQANIQYAAEQVAVQPCLQAQLRILRDRVLASGAMLQPAPVYADDFMDGFVFRTPSRPYDEAAWQALNADGTSSHMRNDRRQVLSSIYGATGILKELRAQTDVLVGRMAMLSHPLPLDPGTRAMLVASLEEQKARSDLQSLVAGQMLGFYGVYGVPIPDTGEDALKDSGTVAFCRKQGLPLKDWLPLMRAPPE